jgi:hypothetical protein
MDVEAGKVGSDHRLSFSIGVFRQTTTREDKRDTRQGE